MGKRAKTLRETDIASRRALVARMYLRGEVQVDIARAAGVDQATVSRDLAALRAAWRSDAVRDFGERQAEELARLDHLEREAWEAWERSKRPAETTTAEKSAGGNGDRTRTAKRVEGRDGDPRFLAVVRECVAKRCEILGLDAPKRSEARVEFPGLPDLKAVSDEKLRALDRLLGECVAGDAPPVASGGPG